MRSWGKESVQTWWHLPWRCVKACGCIISSAVVAESFRGGSGVVAFLRARCSCLFSVDHVQSVLKFGAGSDRPLLGSSPGCCSCPVESTLGWNGTRSIICGRQYLLSRRDGVLIPFSLSLFHSWPRGQHYICLRSTAVAVGFAKGCQGYSSGWECEQLSHASIMQ